MQKLFLNAKAGLPYANDDFEANTPFEVPILEDWYGMTPIETALAQPQDGEFGFFELRKAMKDETKIKSIGQFKDWLIGAKQKKNKKTNIPLAALMLELIKNYSYLHSAPILCEAVIAAINAEVPNIGAYLDGRLVESSHKLRPN